MIITQITIENYKQYRGEHVFDLAEDATIGVIGANGVGKTTIFEAIEWCLYNPRSISNKDVRPRTTGGEVRVVLQMTTDDGARTYEVERILKRSGTQATVYLMNEMGGGEPVVQGTREVTDFISSRLIGLGHSAFVATFFTRQKELSFFGTMRPAERRREVGKLLGFETIKQAQQLIAEERSQVRADAEALQRQYDGRAGDRDLPAEIAIARKTIAEQRDASTQAEKNLDAAEKACRDGEAAVERLQQQRDRHNAVLGELRTLEARQQHTQEHHDGVMRQLERLDQREQERGALAEAAAKEPTLREERTHLDRDRERHQRRIQVTKDLDSCQQTLERARSDVGDIVSRSASATEQSGWQWTGADVNGPLPALDRLIRIGEQVELKQLENRLELFRSARAEATALQKESTTLDRYRLRRDDIVAKLEEHKAKGDPQEERRALEKDLDGLRTQRSNAQASIATATRQMETSRQLIARLEQQHFDDTCPTCGRPFDDAEAEVVISTLRTSNGEHEAAIAAAKATIAEVDRAEKRIQQQQAELADRENAIRDHQARLESAKEYIDNQARAVDECKTRLESALQQLSRQHPPNDEEISQADAAVQNARTIANTCQPLQMLRTTIAASLDAEQRHRQELESLADIKWDEAQWKSIVQQHNDAIRAVSAIEQIDSELARRPQLEHDLATAKTALDELAGSIAEQKAVLESVQFDPEALTKAVGALQEARNREKTERQTVSQTERMVTQAEHALQMLERDQEQLKTLLDEANAKRELRAELDTMYSEFSEFDRYVAQKQSPLLSETTSDIVSEMTDGKYDRVDFDEDYGIQVYDGDDERFPLETFSGGERDAIALAARLALSRLIGSQAANPPGFLVLDEVFGSLDAMRRERVLSLLGQHSSEYFRQMFVVSHVDDVQQSPVFDTIWLVEEGDGGSSQVQTTSGSPDAILAD